MLIIAAIVWKVVEGAWPAIRHFGIGVRLARHLEPGRPSVFGARWFIIGTLVTSFGALLLAAPLSIAIGLFLSELAPPAIRGPIGSLIEMLAAVPSVVDRPLGNLRPRAVHARRTSSRSSHHYFGWIPIFSGARLSRRDARRDRRADDDDDPDHLVDLPRALRQRPARRQGGLARRSARRAGRWCAASSSRTCKGGVVAAVTLGLGRALGEAIAVTQVIGNSLRPFRISLFGQGNTLASQLAASYQSAPTNIELAVARLPRADPARDHVRHERRRAADRPPLRAPAGGRS